MKFGTLVRITDIKNCDSEFKKLKDIGLDCCQLVYKPKVYKLEEAHVIKKSAKDHGIEISAQFAGYPDNHVLWDYHYDHKLFGINIPAFQESRLNYLFAAAEFIRELGITDMIIHAGFIPNNPFSDGYTSMLTSAKILAKKCKSLGLNLLFETGQESPVMLLRLIEDLGMDNLFINLDTANFIISGYGNPVDALFTFGNYVRNMHAKDGVPPTYHKKGNEVPIGQGFVDFKRVIKQLKELNYDRYIVIEREISGEEQTKDIIESLVFLKKLWEEA